MTIGLHGNDLNVQFCNLVHCLVDVLYGLLQIHIHILREFQEIVVAVSDSVYQELCPFNECHALWYALCIVGNVIPGIPKLVQLVVETCLVHLIEETFNGLHATLTRL